MLTFNDIITNEILAKPNGTVPLCDYVINGAFKHWLDNTGVTITSTPSYTATLLLSYINSDGAYIYNKLSRQTHPASQTDVPTTSAYYLRASFTSGTGSNEYVLSRYWLENAFRFNNKPMTLSIWMRASNNTTSIGIEFEQRGFTVNANAISSKKVKLTTTWARYDFVINFPSLVGKVVSGDTAYAMNLWFSAGSNSNFLTRSGGMGHQSGTIDIAKIQLIDGETYQYIPERTYQEEMALIGRYYEKSYDDDVMPGTVTSAGQELVSTVGDSNGHHYFNVKYRNIHRIASGMRTYSPVSGSVNCIRAFISNGSYNGDASSAIDAPSLKGCVCATLIHMM